MWIIGKEITAGMFTPSSAAVGWVDLDLVQILTGSQGFARFPKVKKRLLLDKRHIKDFSNIFSSTNYRGLKKYN